MSLAHFKMFDNNWNNCNEYCQICGKSGNTYGFGNSRYDKNFYTRNLCEKHYKIELRKEKLKKLNENI
jgi:hypothetical protein